MPGVGAGPSGQAPAEGIAMANAGAIEPGAERRGKSGDAQELQDWRKLPADGRRSARLGAVRWRSSAERKKK